MEATIQAPSRRRKWTVEDQVMAEALRAQGWSLARIAAELGATKSSVMYHLNSEYAKKHRIKARERARAKYVTPEGLAAARKAVRRQRGTFGRKSRCQHGLPHRYAEDQLRRHIRSGLVRSHVAQLHRDGWSVESIRSWLDSREKRMKAISRAGRRDLAILLFEPHLFPEGVIRSRIDPESARRRALANYHRKKLIDPAFVLAGRERAHVRRERIRRGKATQPLTGKAIARRFAQFSNRCAYCASKGNLHVEHVIPVSRGGLHHLNNILPACVSCNTTKHTSPMDSWYRQQPFFTEARLDKIKRILGVTRRAPVEQLTLNV